jgi:hypothetical protein
VSERETTTTGMSPFVGVGGGNVGWWLAMKGKQPSFKPLMTLIGLG